MVQEFMCPNCGESEDLSGSKSPEGIRIRCARCDTSWLRDAEAQTCVTCGGAELVQHQRALTQFSRGTQLSIVGLVPVLLCPICDRRMNEWSDAGRPVPFNYRSAALDPDALADRQGDGEDYDVDITP
jgi:hypothetical protein